MEYRRLGRTELQVSVIGVGGGYLMLLEREMATQLYQRAYDLGVNYFDGRYGDSSAKLKPVIAQDREHCFVTSKTAESSAEGALRRIEEDLQYLDTDYIDIFFLRCYNHKMLEERFAPKGALEGLCRAREQGKIRHIGMANHSDPSVLTRAIETDLVDVVLFPLNIIRREALEALIPVTQKHDVGLAVMKPLSVGSIPAQIGLRWLNNQPIHTSVLGMSTLQQLEMDVEIVERKPPALSVEETSNVERCRQKLNNYTCRICDHLCRPVCEPGLPIDWMIYHDPFYEHYHKIGLEAFLEFPLAPEVKNIVEDHFARRLALAQACTRCGLCEKNCPFQLPIMGMIEEMKGNHALLIEAVKKLAWSSRCDLADSSSYGGFFQSRKGK